MAPRKWVVTNQAQDLLRADIQFMQIIFINPSAGFGGLEANFMILKHILHDVFL